MRIESHKAMYCELCYINTEGSRGQCAEDLEACVQRLREAVDTGLAAQGGEGGLREEDLVEILRADC